MDPRGPGNPLRRRRILPRLGYMLVTNDDGVDSPALVPLIRALSELGEVRTVVPAEEHQPLTQGIHH